MIFSPETIHAHYMYASLYFFVLWLLQLVWKARANTFRQIWSLKDIKETAYIAGYIYAYNIETCPNKLDRVARVVWCCMLYKSRNYKIWGGVNRGVKPYFSSSSGYSREMLLPLLTLIVSSTF